MISCISGLPGMGKNVYATYLAKKHFNKENNLLKRFIRRVKHKELYINNVYSTYPIILNKKKIPFYSKHDYLSADNALEKMELSDLKKACYRDLSGGQQQRVALARAIVKNPPLILADEPTGNLDPDMSDEISQVFEQLHKSGKTIILITHDKSVAEKAQRRVIIENGRLENCV